MEKICIRCCESKSLDLFSKNKKHKDGLASLCKKCHKEYRHKHYLLNRDKVLKQVNEYRNNNPDKYIDDNIDDTIYKTEKNNFSKKAGRTVKIKCLECDNVIYITKKEFNENVKKHCSTKCRQFIYKSNYYHYLKDIERRAIKTNKDFDLTEEYLKSLLEERQNNKCAISNVKIYTKRIGEKMCLFNSASLDRIDSNKGYTKDNVQWVVLGINYMKLDYDEKDLHKLLFLIKENYTGVVQR